MVLHALWLECEKSMELAGSSHRFYFLSSSREGRNEAALSESVTTGAWRKERKGLALFFPTWHIILAPAKEDTLFRRK